MNKVIGDKFKVISCSPLYYWLLAVGYWLLAVNSFAQDRTDYEKAKAKFPGQNAVFLLKKEEVTIKVKEEKISISAEHLEDICITGDKVDSYTEKSITYTSFERIFDIDAKTYIPSGTGYKSIAAAAASTHNDISGGTFYDDTETKKIVFPALQKEARTILKYKEEMFEPKFFGRFFFNSYVPMIESSFVVNVPKGVVIEYKMMNTDSFDIKLDKKENGKYTTYTWTGRNLKDYSVESDGPGILYTAPHIIVYIKEYEVKGEKKKFIGSPEDLYKWHFNFIKKVDIGKTCAMKAIVDSLIAKEKTEFDKAKKIFYWVEDNINYIAFEDSLAGFIPREPSAICNKRYGDCKDMASITTAMLRCAGIDAHLVWVGTRSIPYSCKEVPLSMCFNHMIAAYFKDGKYYFLDATGKYQPIDMPTYAIQGKDVLVEKGEKDFEIVQIPFVEKERNTVTDTARIEIKDKKINGRSTFKLTGYNKINLVFDLKYTKPEDLKEFFTGNFNKGSNKMQLDTVYYSGENEKDRPDMTVNYTFNIPDYVNSGKDELYVNMALSKYMSGEKIDLDERKTDLEWDFKQERRYTVVLDVPAGYKATFIPQNSKFDNGQYGFDIKYEQAREKIYMSTYVYVDAIFIKKKDFAEWNKFIKQLKKAYNESVILGKK